MEKTVIGILVGSARRASFSKHLAQTIVSYLPQDIEALFLDIENLPLFNQDYDDDNNIPESWLEFRGTMKRLDGFLIVTPEYNRSIPPILKNAIDISSRPMGHSPWDGLPGGVISVTPGKLGGYGAQQHLRQVLTCLNANVMQRPETYIGEVMDIWDDTGKVANPKTEAFLQSIATSLVQWIQRNSR